jgi:hypothetical protein
MLSHSDVFEKLPQLGHSTAASAKQKALHRHQMSEDLAVSNIDQGLHQPRGGPDKGNHVARKLPVMSPDGRGHAASCGGSGALSIRVRQPDVKC